MNVEHMPYYWGPCLLNLQHSSDSHDDIVANPDAQDQAPDVDVNYAGALLLTRIVTSGKMGFTSLSNHPIQFGTFSPANMPDIRPILRVLYNSDLPIIAYSASHFPWVIYGFNSGHFVSTIKQRNFPFSIRLACNPYARGRALFHEVAKCSTVLPSAGALLDHISASGITSPVNGYLIHSHWYQSSEPTTTFGLLQASIVEQLHAIQKLRLFIAFVHPDHDGRSVTKFVAQLHPHGWIISKTQCSFPDYGNSVVGTS
jgi:hypothetical protein